MTVLLDPLDAAILRLLRDDARLSFRDVAQATGSTVPTVSARVKALEDIGLIRGYHADVDIALSGGALVHVTLHAKPSEARRIADDLARAPGVEDVALLSGGHVHARVRLRPPDMGAPQLHETLAAMDGVLSYDVREVLAARETRAHADLPERVDVRCHQCQGPIHETPVRKAFGARTHVFCCRTCLATFGARHAKLEASVQGGR